MQRSLNIVTPANDIPPTNSLTEEFENLANIEEETKSDQEYSDARLDFETPNITNMINDNERCVRNEQNDIKTLVQFRGKSELIAQELLDSIENLRKQYHWNDDRTIRVFGSRLKGNKLLEWLYTVKQLPEDEDKWNTVRSAFSRDFIKMSKIKRWKELSRIKQKKGQSLEVYRGTLEKLIGPTGIKEEEKVAIFIMGLRKHYRSLLGSKKNYKTMSEIIRKLRENEDFGSESEDDQASDVSDSESDQDSSSSSDSDSDSERKRRKFRKKIKMKKREVKNKGNRKNKKEDLLSRQLKSVQDKLEKLMKSSQNTVFSINEINSTKTNVPVMEDLKTTNGLDVCGRCQRVGHIQNNCARTRMRCNNCGILGHITPECRKNPNIQSNFNNNFQINRGNGFSANRGMNFQVNRGNNFVNNQNRPSLVCFNCNQPGHVRQKCPRMNQKVAAINNRVNGNNDQGVLNR